MGACSRTRVVAILLVRPAVLCVVKERDCFSGGNTYIYARVLSSANPDVVPA